MKPNNYLNFPRLLKVLNRETNIRKKGYITGTLVVAALFFIIMLISAKSSFTLSYSETIKVFYFVLFIGGMIFTSRIFSELHEPQTSYQFLSLPASNLEKLIAQWFISSIGYILTVLIILLVSATLGGMLGAALFRPDFVWIDLAELKIGEMLLPYFTLHAIFFLGAITFRKRNFLKTAIAIFIVSMFLALTVLAIGYLTIGDNIYALDDASASFKFMAEKDQVLRILDMQLDYLIAPFFLVVSYFKLKERQV